MQEERKFKHFKFSNNNTSIEQLQEIDNNHTSWSNYKSKKNKRGSELDARICYVF